MNLEDDLCSKDPEVGYTGLLRYLCSSLSMPSADRLARGFAVTVFVATLVGSKEADAVVAPGWADVSPHHSGYVDAAKDRHW